MSSKIDWDNCVEPIDGISLQRSTVDPTIAELEYVYAGVAKNGNKITFVLALNVTRLAEVTSYKHFINLGNFIIPTSLLNKIYPGYSDDAFGGVVCPTTISCATALSTFSDLHALITKENNNQRICYQLLECNNLTINTKYYVRC